MDSLPICAIFLSGWANSLPVVEKYFLFPGKLIFFLAFYIIYFDKINNVSNFENWL